MSDEFDNKESLFRTEVLTRDSSRLYGNINVFNYMPWRKVYYVIFIFSIALIAASVTIPIPRSINVSAIVVPKHGVSKVIVPKDGFVEYLYISQGKLVNKGDAIAQINTKIKVSTGKIGQEEVEQSLSRQMNDVDNKIVNAAMRATIGKEKFLLDNNVAKNALKELINQQNLQKELIKKASEALERARILQSKGFVSNTYFESLQENLLSRQQKLSELAILINNKYQEISTAKFNSDNVEYSLKDEQSALRIQRNDIAQQVVQNSLSGSFLLSAPVKGIVSNSRFDTGHAVKVGDAFIDIVPVNKDYIIRLDIPSGVVSSIHTGQKISVSFSYENSIELNSAKAVISSISETASEKADGSVFYTAYATIDKNRLPKLLATKLRSNLTGNANIVIERLTFLEWLLKPIRM